MSGRIELIDTSLRDGHQSLLATRMSTQQCLRVLPLLRDCGYSILELWGGATLDSALRFTHDDPFERLDRFREVLAAHGPGRAGRVQIRSLCRGQNLFGYTPYADNVVFQFIKEAVRSGNDRVRIFDALNDPRNLLTAVMATKTFDGHAEVALSYTTSPVHDVGYFVRFAEAALDNGGDSLAIKDMAGLLHPADCFALVAALRRRFPDKIITLHSHCTNGLAVTSYVAGMLAGVHQLDTAHGPMAGSTSQPPVELIVWFARELGLETNVDAALFPRIDAELRQIRRELHAVDKDPDRFGEPWPAEPPAAVRRKLRQALKLIETRERDKLDQAIAIIEDEVLVPQGYPAVDRTQLDAQVPGGMISNLHHQLKQIGKLENLPKILEEIPRVRADAGYVPLVTPTSQIVGSQAAFNVNSGRRYSVISDPFRDLILGKYGRLPAPPNPEVVKLCSPTGELYSGRPAEYAPKADLDQVLAEADGLIKTHRDLLLCLLFPQPAKAFLARRQAQPAAASPA